MFGAVGRVDISCQRLENLLSLTFILAGSGRLLMFVTLLVLVWERGDNRSHPSPVKCILLPRRSLVPEYQFEPRFAQNQDLEPSNAMSLEALGQVLNLLDENSRAPSCVILHSM